MTESKRDTVIRLEREADALEQRSKHILSISHLLAGAKSYNQILLDAQSMAAEAAALRQQARGLQAGR